MTLIPLQKRLTGNLRGTLWVLMSAVGVVWLIACSNVANLLFARAAGRTRQIGLRAALGAGCGRVVRQLTESGVLAGVAGLAGLLLASMLVQGVVEVALSVILLATAGLLARSFLALQHVDLGFTADRVLVAYTEYAVTEDRTDIRTRSRFYWRSGLTTRWRIPDFARR